MLKPIPLIHVRTVLGGKRVHWDGLMRFVRVAVNRRREVVIIFVFVVIVIMAVLQMGSGHSK